MLADMGRDRRETLFIGEEFSRDPRACWDYGLELQTRENRGQLSDRQTLSPGPAGAESAGLPAQPGSSRVQIVPPGNAEPWYDSQCCHPPQGEAAHLIPEECWPHGKGLPCLWLSSLHTWVLQGLRMCPQERWVCPQEMSQVPDTGPSVSPSDPSGMGPLEVEITRYPRGKHFSCRNISILRVRGSAG